MMDGSDDPKEREDSADRERLDYVLAERRLRGTRAEVLDELDELILALVGLRRKISTQHGADGPRRKPRWRLFRSLTIILLLVTPRPGIAQTAEPPVASVPPDTATATWQYGGFVDLGYLRDGDDPSDKLFRSRGTTWHLNEWHLNMSGAYAKKKPTEQSRWGTELLVHAGKDDEVFGFSATAPNIAGDEWLRHVGLANVSYLLRAGEGPTLQAGIFPSLIGYDSLYAKDNFNYTRPWGADFTPYLMMGINVSYPFTKKLTGTVYVVNGYWHLANANRIPSSGGQVAYKATSKLTLKETVLWGPHQSNTSLEFWRFLSDTIVEHRTDRLVVALNSHFATETVDAPARPRAWWVAAQLPIRWTFRRSLSAAFRPEVAWDSGGRWTLAEQTVKAMTSTVEYRIPYKSTNTTIRLEHRFDDSLGPGGGFFDNDVVRAGTARLKRTQHLLIFGAILTLDSVR